MFISSVRELARRKQANRSQLMLSQKRKQTEDQFLTTLPPVMALRNHLPSGLDQLSFKEQETW